MSDALIDAAEPALAEFRTSTRAWLRENFPSSLAEDLESQQALARQKTLPDGDFKIWRDRMAARGWTAPGWPTAYGGGGLTTDEVRVLSEELAAIGAAFPLAGIGPSILGPTVLQFGTEAQRQAHLPGIVTGEVRWCQGFSEPNAGSDLANLQTRAEDIGDDFLVNGSKIWTSGAHLSDWCFCLVRTDFTRKHEGISFLLIDMRSPGIETRPIRLISGESPFCETFFTDVRVPKTNLLGDLNAGWSIAKRLLQFERSSIGNRSHEGKSSDDAPQTLFPLALERLGRKADGTLADSELRARITRYEMDERAVQLTRQRIARESEGSRDPSQAVSIMKNASMRVAQDRAELQLEILGQSGLGWDGEGFSPEDLEAQRAFLHSKAFTIYGGTEEVQNNIIARRILGLPT